MHVFIAVDGRKLTHWSQDRELERLFWSYPWKANSAIIACALSHYKIWKHIADVSCVVVLNRLLRVFVNSSDLSFD